MQVSNAQSISIDLNLDWQFKYLADGKWYDARVPGSIHADLLKNKLVPDPYFRDNETNLQWIDQTDWLYKRKLRIDSSILAHKKLELVFDGLDTYAEVRVNNQRVLLTDNMFRQWKTDVKHLLKRGWNEISIHFSPSQKIADSIAKSKLPLVLPDNNRVYVRKAQFQFGWDWGPKFVGCGIWKKVRLNCWNNLSPVKEKPTIAPFASLIQQKDTIGTSFYFEKDGKPVYVKGVNWIPGDALMRYHNKKYYQDMLRLAKEANINMIRVWGGGVYEDDEFYDQCDQLGILVWQDFMFAGGMYPGDEAFMSNVREEVKYQIERLKKHPCIVLWCGNNEVEEAWKNWGWQNQFNLHGADSAKVWNDYKRLFQDSLKKWVDEFDGTRPYISTSPKHGWGRAESLTEGDSHYWGVWWGLEDWEVFENKTGRFVSEYGMQSMPNWNTIENFTDSSDRYLYSPVIQSHQKASDGFKKLDHYLTRYFIDSARLSKLSLEDYTYLSQCMQYYILKNSIAVHRSKYPTNMGTLLWQLNDCWPVTSWSIVDYSRQPKAAWYAVKEAYRDDVIPVTDKIYPRNLILEKPQFSITITAENLYIQSNTAAKYVYISSGKPDIGFFENYFDLEPYKQKIIRLKNNTRFSISDITIKSLYDVLKL